MSIRVASFSFARQAIHFSSLHNSSILDQQEKISSGVEFQRPSESPIAFRQATSLKSRFTELTADRNTIDQATSTLNASVAQLQSFSLVVTRAKGLTQQGVQALEDDTRNALALEVDGLIDQLKGITLSQFDDRFLFGGTKTDAPPFEFNEINTHRGSIEVTYKGGDRNSRASVGDFITIDTFYNGLEVFAGGGREPTVLVGQTGARTGTGTDTLIGRSRLDVTHDTTTYAAGSGILAGASSPGGDTIIGNHTLTIVDTAGDGSAGTISLNGSTAVPFTSADTNLLVEGPFGQAVYVDASNITAGFNGDVAATASGNLSVDDGDTQLPIDFSSNQTVIDSLTGRFVTIDSASIRQTGQDHLEFPGTANAIELLANLASDLRNTRELDGQGYALSLDRRLGELEELSGSVFELMGEQATSLRTMDTLRLRVDDLRLSVETRLSDVQSTDLPDAVLRLETSQTLLQYTYAATASINQLSLLDFLR